MSKCDFNDKRRVFFFLVVVLLFAVFFRFYALSELPPFLDIDEAVNGVKAEKALATGDFSFFYKVDTLVMHGEPFLHEGLMVNLTALSLSIFGHSPTAIRIVSASIGLLTVLGLFLLASEFFGLAERKRTASNEAASSCSRTRALIAAFLLAISLWHVIFSRMGFNAILTPLVAAFSFYFLIRAFRGLKSLDFLLAGALLGLSLHTYLSNRLLPFVAVAAFLLFMLERRRIEGETDQRLKPGIILFWLSWLIVASPIILYFLQNPGDFSSRASDLSIYDQPGWPFLLLKNFFITLGQFNFKGDPFLRHNLPGSAALIWPVGIFFIIGFVISIYKSIDFFGKKVGEKWLFVYPLLILWLIITLAPAFLSEGPHPHAHRSLNAVLPAHLLASMGAYAIFASLKEFASRRGHCLPILLSLIILLLIAAGEYRRYFVLWAAHEDIGEHFSEELSDIASFINGLPPETKKFVLVNFYGPQPVQFLTGTYLSEGRAARNVRYLEANQNIDIDFSVERPYVLIPLSRDPETLQIIRRNVPGVFISKERFDYIVAR